MGMSPLYIHGIVCHSRIRIQVRLRSSRQDPSPFDRIRRSKVVWLRQLTTQRPPVKFAGYLVKRSGLLRLEQTHIVHLKWRADDDG